MSCYGWHWKNLRRSHNYQPDKIKRERKSAIRLIVLLSDQNLMKNFRKIGSSFLDRLCGIWSPIPLEVRSCALRQSISTPPWQQQCSPNDCTMGSKLFYCVKNILPCKNYIIVSELFYCVKTTLLRQNYFIVSNHGGFKEAPDNHLLYTLKNNA